MRRSLLNRVRLSYRSMYGVNRQTFAGDFAGKLSSSHQRLSSTQLHAQSSQSFSSIAALLHVADVIAGDVIATESRVSAGVSVDSAARQICASSANHRRKICESSANQRQGICAPSANQRRSSWEDWSRWSCETWSSGNITSTRTSRCNITSWDVEHTAVRRRQTAWLRDDIDSGRVARLATTTNCTTTTTTPTVTTTTAGDTGLPLRQRLHALRAHGRRPAGVGKEGALIVPWNMHSRPLQGSIYLRYNIFVCTERTKILPPNTFHRLKLLRALPSLLHTIYLDWKEAVLCGRDGKAAWTAEERMERREEKEAEESKKPGWEMEREGWGWTLPTPVKVLRAPM